MIICNCCGMPGFGQRVGNGFMHPKCWDEHHSHPIENPWPEDHECKGGGAR